MLPSFVQPYRLPETNQDRFRKACGWIHHLRNNPWFKSQMPVTITTIAAALNITFPQLYEYLRGEIEVSDITNRILNLEKKIISREAVFVEGHGIYYLDPRPPKLMPPIIKRTWDSEDWKLHATCRACGYNQYLPADMNTDDYALCYHCIPLNQYGAYGARAQEGSMILYALDEMGILEDIRLLHEKPAKVKPEPTPTKAKRITKPYTGGRWTKKRWVTTTGASG